jgi:hypothetical protein
MSTTIELVTYRLNAQSNQADLMGTHAGVNTFLQKQPGFIYRSSSEDDSGLIYDICYWESLELAKAANDAFMQSKDCLALMQVCDKESVVMRHMTANSEAMQETSAA